MTHPCSQRSGGRPMRMCVAVLAVALFGCVSTPPPVQEMSDARQAVEAARMAGAEEHAPKLYQRSVDLLHGAERTLEDEGYTQARNQALGARRLALEALKEAERLKPRDRR